MQSPGIGKDRIWEENLKAILHGKDRVGMAGVNIILSPQFNDPSLRNMEMERQKDIRSSGIYIVFSSSFFVKTTVKSLLFFFPKLWLVQVITC